MSSTRARLLADNIPIDAVTTRLFGNGSTLSFTINGSVGLINPNNLIVALDGAVQEPGIDYTVNNNTVSFSTAPDNGAKVVVVYRNAPFTTTSIVPTTNTVTTSTIQLNAITPEKLSLGAPTWNTDGNLNIINNINLLNNTFTIGNSAQRGILINNQNTLIRSANHVNSKLSLQTFNGQISALTVSNNGYIGVGTNDPQSLLHVSFSSINLDGDDDDQSYRYRTGILTTTPDASGSFTLGVGGNVHFTSLKTNSAFIFRCTKNTNSPSLSSTMFIGPNKHYTYNIPITDCPTTVKAFLNFSETTFAAAGGGAGPAIAPASTSIDQIVAGLDTGRWTFNSARVPNIIGTIWYFNIGGNNTQYGGVDWTKGVQITSINGTFAFFKILGGPATVTPSQSVVGNATTNGYSYQSFGIRNSFNVASITRQHAGRYRITFKTAMTNDWFVALVGAANSAIGDGSWTVIDYATTAGNSGKQAFSTKNYIDIASYDGAATPAAIDTPWTYFAILDQDYNPNY